MVPASAWSSPAPSPESRSRSARSPSATEISCRRRSTSPWSSVRTAASSFAVHGDSSSRTTRRGVAFAGVFAVAGLRRCLCRGLCWSLGRGLGCDLRRRWRLLRRGSLGRSLRRRRGLGGCGSLLGWRRLRGRCGVRRCLLDRRGLGRCLLGGCCLLGRCGLGWRQPSPEPFFAAAVLAGALFAGAFLAGAVLAGAFLAGAVFAGAALAEAFLPGLRGAFFAGAVFAGAFLAGAVLADTVFVAGAFLAGAAARADVPLDPAARPTAVTASPSARRTLPAGLLGSAMRGFLRRGHDHGRLQEDRSRLGHDQFDPPRPCAKSGSGWIRSPRLGPTCKASTGPSPPSRRKNRARASWTGSSLDPAAGERERGAAPSHPRRVVPRVRRTDAQGSSLCLGDRARRGRPWRRTARAMQQFPPRWTCRRSTARCWRSGASTTSSRAASQQTEGREPWVFYEGPPTANGMPGDAPRRGARLQGRLPALPDDEGLPRPPQGRLGLPRPARRARGGEGARLHGQERHRGVRRRRVQRPLPGQCRAARRRVRGDDPSGWATGSTCRRPTGRWTRPTSRASGGRSSRSSTRACSSRTTGSPPTARGAAPACPTTSSRRATRRSSTPRSTSGSR